MATGVKKPGLIDRGVATGVTKFHMASGGLKLLLDDFNFKIFFINVFVFLELLVHQKWS